MSKFATLARGGTGSRGRMRTMTPISRDTYGRSGSAFATSAKLPDRAAAYGNGGLYRYFQKKGA